MSFKLYYIKDYFSFLASYRRGEIKNTSDLINNIHFKKFCESNFVKDSTSCSIEIFKTLSNYSLF